MLEYLSYGMGPLRDMIHFTSMLLFCIYILFCISFSIFRMAKILHLIASQISISFYFLYAYYTYAYVRCDGSINYKIVGAMCPYLCRRHRFYRSLLLFLLLSIYAAIINKHNENLNCAWVVGLMLLLDNGLMWKRCCQN